MCSNDFASVNQVLKLRCRNELEQKSQVRMFCPWLGFSVLKIVKLSKEPITNWFCQVQQHWTSSLEIFFRKTRYSWWWSVTFLFPRLKKRILILYKLDHECNQPSYFFYCCSYSKLFRKFSSFKCVEAITSGKSSKTFDFGVLHLKFAFENCKRKKLNALEGLI